MSSSTDVSSSTKKVVQTDDVPIEDVFYVNDPVHGSIELRGKYIRPIIDTPEFQRLRKIKQLGGACYVYPGATHTRFEHSIGVCFIASELMSHLIKHDRLTKNLLLGKKYEDIDFEKCVKVAALCHDLGHGPYSHLYDIAVSAVCPNNPNDDENCLKDHEFRSVKIFQAISAKLNIVSDKEKEIIGDMITFSKLCEKDRGLFLEGQITEEDYYDRVKIKIKIGKKTKKEAEEKLTNGDTLFLYEIVANGFTEIDVDKMDYFIRDGHGLGLSSFFDWRRYIQTLKVCPVFDSSEEKKVYRLCSRDKEAPELYQLFHIRNQLYRQAYKHKTTIAVENMLKRAMISADKSNMSITGSDGEEYTFLTAWKNTSAFLKLNDSFEDILANKDLPADDKLPCTRKVLQYSFSITGENIQELKNAKKIINRIKDRELIKFVDEWKSQQQQIELACDSFNLSCNCKLEPKIELPMDTSYKFQYMTAARASSDRSKILFEFVGEWKSQPQLPKAEKVKTDAINQSLL